MRFKHEHFSILNYMQSWLCSLVRRRYSRYLVCTDAIWTDCGCQWTETLRHWLGPEGRLGGRCKFRFSVSDGSHQQCCTTDVRGVQRYIRYHTRVKLKQRLHRRPLWNAAETGLQCVCDAGVWMMEIMPFCTACCLLKQIVEAAFCSCQTHSVIKIRASEDFTSVAKWLPYQWTREANHSVSSTKQSFIWALR